MLSVAHWFSFSNPPLTAERKPQVVDIQTLAALFVSQKLHQKCTDFFLLLSKNPFLRGFQLVFSPFFASPKPDSLRK